MYIGFDECIREAGGKPFKTVLHIGAHHGEEIQAYEANGVKKVIWIEANRDILFECIKQTEFSSVEQLYFDVCLSDKEEEVNFHIASNGQSSSLFELGTHAQMYPHITYVEHRKMMTQRFDEWISTENKAIIIDINMQEIDFINLDVQGAELKVLKGFGDYLASPTLRAIYTEINLEEVYKGCCQIEDLDEYLGQYNFERTLVAAPERTWGDALYLRKT
jgi:FkbM family methyltransferase